MIKIEMKVSEQQITDQLCNALEGGANYWYFLPDLTMLDSNTKNWPLADRIMNVIKQGKSIPIYDIEECKENTRLGYLNLKGIEKGLEIMSTEYPGIFEEIINENGDANTGDIFLQLSVMGKIVYG